MNGHATEDESEGYALTNDPRARKAELAIRDYALQHEDLIFQVIDLVLRRRASRHRRPDVGRMGVSPTSRSTPWSSPASTRMMMFAMTPYGRWKSSLPRSRPWLTRIPPEPFIRLLRSGSWLDHNKASLVLVALTTTRDPQLLAQLRAEALDPLLEMGSLAQHRTRRSRADDPGADGRHRRGRRWRS